MQADITKFCDQELEMGTYEVTFIVNNQRSVVLIRATSAGAAGNLVRAQYRGCDVNISNISEIR